MGDRQHGERAGNAGGLEVANEGEERHRCENHTFAPHRPIQRVGWVGGWWWNEMNPVVSALMAGDCALEFMVLGNLAFAFNKEVVVDTVVLGLMLTNEDRCSWRCGVLHLILGQGERVFEVRHIAG